MRAEAAALAQELGLPLALGPDFIADLLLVVTPQRLELHEAGSKAAGPVYADFVAGETAHRRRFGGGRGQPLARAVGLRGGVMPTVLDATAGLGRDAFVLATLGCAVTLVERSKAVAALLRDGLRRAQGDPEAGPVVARMKPAPGDAAAVMLETREGERAEVVYLDPMYPHSGKSALKGKEMRLFRKLVGDDEDAPALLEAALAYAAKRVVVKRPRLAPPLAGPKPSAAITGKTTRFDVYLLDVYLRY